MNLVEDNLGLVGALARRFIGKGIEYEDLYSAGSLGLCKAAKRFDKTKGFAFSTYAVPVILGEIKALFRDGGAVKVSRSVKELSVKITKITATYSAEKGRSPTVSELSLVLNVSPEQITEALNAAQPTVSLTADDAENEFDIPTEDHSELVDLRLSLADAIKHLEENDRKLIILRYYGNKTQQETAKLLGISQVQVSRREKKALNCLKLELLG